VRLLILVLYECQNSVKECIVVHAVTPFAIWEVSGLFFRLLKLELRHYLHWLIKFRKKIRSA
jgi:hypothetical protein